MLLQVAQVELWFCVGLDVLRMGKANVKNILIKGSLTYG